MRVWGRTNRRRPSLGRTLVLLGLTAAAVLIVFTGYMLIGDAQVSNVLPPRTPALTAADSRSVPAGIGGSPARVVVQRADAVTTGQDRGVRHRRARKGGR